MYDICRLELKYYTRAGETDGDRYSSLLRTELITAVKRFNATIPRRRMFRLRSEKEDLYPLSLRLNETHVQKNILRCWFTSLRYAYAI